MVTISIVAATSSAPVSEPVPVPDPVSVAAEEAAITVDTSNLLLDLRNDFTPFNIPSIEEVVASVNETFPEDGIVIVQQFRGRGQGTFRICLSTPISDLATCRVTFGENISVPVSDYTPRFSGKGNPAEKRGTLVTFVEAAIGTHRTLRNEDFDKALAPW